MLGIRHSRLYKQVYADDTLTEAWRHVRTGTDQAGVDGVTVVQFQARLVCQPEGAAKRAHAATLSPTTREAARNPEDRWQPASVRDFTASPIGSSSVPSA